MHKYGKLSIINCQLSIPQNRGGFFNIWRAFDMCLETETRRQ